MLYPPNCGNEPIVKPTYCLGYEKEKIKEPCPCTGMNSMDKSKWIYPPAICPHNILRKFCVGYEKEKILTPNCPCSNQQGMDVKDMKYPPKCPDPSPVKEFCSGWEKEEIYPPCPCTLPPQDKSTPKDKLLYAGNCKEVCAGDENKKVKKYKPDCDPPIPIPPKDVCDEYKD
jgi:hypothetical protein